MFTNLNLTDMETCYKVFRREVLQGMELQVEPLRLRAGDHRQDRQAAAPAWRIYEVPISYSGRTYEEGKKIGLKDAFNALVLHRPLLAEGLMILATPRPESAREHPLADSGRGVTNGEVDMRTLLAMIAALMVISPAQASDLRPFEDAPLFAVQFVDTREGWAAGADGVVWHSIDSGKNWERQPTGTRAVLRSVCFINPYVGWVVGREELPHGGGSSASCYLLAMAVCVGRAWPMAPCPD